MGFDLGASDRKASAVIDGEPVFSEEIVWDPKNATNPEYQYQGIMDSIRRAASHLPRLDAVGGSAAGVYINNRVRVGSLYRGISPKDFAEKIAPLFLRIRKELGVPMEVVNDGEVTALAGSMSIGENPVLGVALGSSEAVGYVNREGNITSWLNELAFAPVDYRVTGPQDEWSGDCCGAQYFSQQATNRVAVSAGMQFPDGLGLPERLVTLQKKMTAGDRWPQRSTKRSAHTSATRRSLCRFLRPDTRADPRPRDDRPRRRHHPEQSARSLARGISAACFVDFDRASG